MEVKFKKIVLKITFWLLTHKKLIFMILKGKFLKDLKFDACKNLYTSVD